MRLTEQNVGDVFVLYRNGSRVKIDAVGDSSFSYYSENGAKYVSQDTCLSGFPETNHGAIAEFNENMLLGQSLFAAQQSALSKYFNHTSVKEKARASHVLNHAREQLQNFNARLVSCRSPFDRERAERFLLELCENGAGSSGVYLGHTVEMAGSHFGNFLIDGKEYDVASAANFLSGKGSQVHSMGASRKSLDSMIQEADAKRIARQANEKETPNKGFDASFHER